MVFERTRAGSANSHTVRVRQTTGAIPPHLRRISARAPGGGLGCFLVAYSIDVTPFSMTSPPPVREPACGQQQQPIPRCTGADNRAARTPYSVQCIVAALSQSFCSRRRPRRLATRSHMQLGARRVVAITRHRRDAARARDVCHCKAVHIAPADTHASTRVWFEIESFALGRFDRAIYTRFAYVEQQHRRCVLT